MKPELRQLLLSLLKKAKNEGLGNGAGQTEVPEKSAETAKKKALLFHKKLKGWVAWKRPLVGL